VEKYDNPLCVLFVDCLEKKKEKETKFSSAVGVESVSPWWV
jgi:hypothetical protein